MMFPPIFRKKVERKLKSLNVTFVQAADERRGAFDYENSDLLARSCSSDSLFSPIIESQESSCDRFVDRASTLMSRFRDSPMKPVYNESIGEIKVSVRTGRQAKLSNYKCDSS
jgi:hypothetical protein